MDTQPVFLTWRLRGSLPPGKLFSPGNCNPREEFAAMDRLLDQAICGPRYLSVPAIADQVLLAIQFHSESLGHCELHAFVLMPNHVHLLLTPKMPVEELARSLGGATARRANTVLALDGKPFWAKEPFHYAVEGSAEFEEVRDYIEGNPVRAGLAAAPEEFPWSSAWLVHGDGKCHNRSKPNESGTCRRARNNRSTLSTP